MSSSRVLRGALSGFGLVAENAHVPAWLGRTDFQIAAVAEPDPQRRAHALARLPQVRTYPSLEELLRSEVELDFVDISTPPFLHAPQTLLSLERGLHVLCEKPLAFNIRDLRAIESAARAKKRVVYTVDNWRHAPLFQKLFSLVDEGALGEIIHVELHTLRVKPAAAALGPWRTDAKLSGGGVLMDHGWHSLYLLHRLLGAAWEEISSRLSAPEGGGTEEDATIFLRFPSATALLRQTWLAQDRSNWGVVYGRRGSLDIRDDSLQLRSGRVSQDFSFPERLSQGSAHPSWFQAMLGDFGRALHDRKDWPGENFRAADFCLQTISSVYQAA